MSNILEKFYFDIENAKKSSLVEVKTSEQFDLFVKKQVILLTFDNSVKIPTVCKVFDHLYKTYKECDFEIKMRSTHKISITRNLHRMLL
ncbi:hypothetical protein EBU94_07945 [bacterium]|nr:hypothetical protein [bacterium]